MAIDKNSNAYTFTFAIIMVVVVGTLLAVASQGLKTRQDKNATDKKMISILSAINIEASRDNAQDMFNMYVVDSKIISGKDLNEEAFDIDIKKEYRDKTLAAKDRNYPLYICEKDSKRYYVIPVIGTGLWGPIWGFVALESDFKTIYGCNFDHKSETPGLGAEIKENFFAVKFNGKTLAEAAPYFSVLKGGSNTDQHSVDGITGGTITSKGVEEMLNRTLDIYKKFFESEEK